MSGTSSNPTKSSRRPLVHRETDRQSDRQADRDRQTVRQTDRQADRDRQTVRQTDRGRLIETDYIYILYQSNIQSISR